ncbi:MAG: non-hydrolyzing UDP-N-acetylglucosamine 2-epimerase [Candidatus Binatia bacterium]
MKLLVIFGTRPEAIKLAPVIQALRKQLGIKTVVCVTAQQREMLDQILSVFEITPDYDLNIMQPNQSLFDVVSRTLVKLRDVLQVEQPHMVLVQGDTTTAFVGALGAYYLQIPVAHVEAGLRTYDKYRPFPEEMNRACIDNMADLCFAPTEWAKANLLRQGIEPLRISVTGNTVVDALLTITQKLGDPVQSRERVSHLFDGLPPTLATRLFSNSMDRKLVLVTGHRRESFGPGFENICWALKQLAQRNPDIEIIYPVHLNPLVREPVHRILGDLDRIHLIEPLPYMAFVWLMRQAYLILTDSGGIQEEAPCLGKPVLIMRDTTERPEGLEAGVARLVGTEASSIISAVEQLVVDPQEYHRAAEVTNLYGNGKSSERIVRAIIEWSNQRNENVYARSGKGDIAPITSSINAGM